jgi:hypothetical protein
MALCRTLHIYITMFAFLMMMFFAVTGLILNHEALFASAEGEMSEATGIIPVELLNEPDRLMVVETLRSTFGATGSLTTFDTEPEALRIELRGPGRRTEAEIDRATGKTTVMIERRGMVIRLDDLHRGKDSGRAWSLVLDVSSVLLFLGSLTGIVMLFALPRRRKLGLAALAAGTVITLAVYFVFVP